MMTILKMIVLLFYAYLGIGIVFALWFTMRGVNRLDAGMQHAPWGVRALIFPGSVLLWIVLFIKYLRAR